LYNRRLVSAISLILLVSLLVSVTPTTSKPQPSNPQFVLAEWDYPDEYGQGIKRFIMYENSTGSWVQVGDYLDYNDDNEVQWNDSRYIKLRCVTLFNATLTQAPTVEAGKSYLQHSIIVTNTGVTVFSQQNFTFVSGAPEAYGMYIYSYDVVLNFLPVGGQVYTVSVDYDVYYPEDTGSDVLTATSGSTDAGSPTGDYTDTHDQDLVFFGGTDPTDMSVDLWVEFSDPISEFNYSVYWNSASGGEIHIYDHDASDWVILDGSPNGDGGPIAWDNDTVSNEDYYNETHVGFRLYCGIVDGAAINVDYYHIHTSPGYHWVDINELNLYFPISYSSEQVFLGNFAFILLGLVMVPASTIYLVYGGRDKLTQDKFFYFLIAFIIGWAFIIGGVMP